MKYLKRFSLLESVSGIEEEIDIMVQDISDAGMSIHKNVGWCNKDYNPYEYFSGKASQTPFKDAVRLYRLEIRGGKPKKLNDKIIQNVDLELLSDILSEVNQSVDRLSDIGQVFTQISVHGKEDSDEPQTSLIHLSIWIRTNEVTHESPKETVIELTKDYFIENGYEIRKSDIPPKGDPDYFFLDVFPENREYSSTRKLDYDKLSAKANDIFEEIKKIVAGKVNIRNGRLFNGYSLKIFIDP